MLEFNLFKQIVLYAEEVAGLYGTKPEFSVTTNGTLLTDDKIHFLVGHKFSVTVSVDGPKHIHDQYRVFAVGENFGRKTGSYDVVMKNVERFVELYPHYPDRAIAVTITATSNYAEINEFLKSLWPATFPIVTVSIVRATPNDPRKGEREWSVRAGCCDVIPCSKGLCRGELGLFETDSRNIKKMVNLSSSPEKPEESGAVHTPAFANWTKDQWDAFESGYHRFVEEMEEECDVVAILGRWPLYISTFANEMTSLHRRAILRHGTKSFFAYGCSPGSTRTFCSSQGKLYPCERTGTGQLFELGNAVTGVNVKSVIRLTESRRLNGECANCAARTACILCPEMMSEENTSGKIDSLAFRKVCRGQIESAQRQLEEYTTIMETNPKGLDKLLPLHAIEADDWAVDVKFLPTDEQLREVELGVEELEPMV